MAERPNWFDGEYAGSLEKATAEQALTVIASSPRIIQAVKDALTAHDANSKKPGWVGPTRTQVIRSAVAEVLQTIS